MNIKFLLFFATIIILSSIISSQTNHKNDIHKKIHNLTNEAYSELVSIRRDIHKYPEIAGNEKNTAKKISKYLKNLNIEVINNVGGYGVVGILKGKNDGPTIAYRADIDAMKDSSPDPVEFKSQIDDIRHICGHDIHTTIALGIASNLSKIRNQLNGNVMFLFQPAEENFTGAKKMIEDGVFDKIKPEVIYGLHVIPAPSGTISVKPKNMFRTGKFLQITFTKTSDYQKIIEFCKEQLVNLSTESPGSKYFNFATLGDPEFGMGGPNSLYRNYFVTHPGRIKTEVSDSIVAMYTLFESSNTANFEKHLKLLKQNIQNSVFRSFINEPKYVKDFTTVYNDPAFTTEAVKIISNVFGENSVTPVNDIIPFFNDDFAFFQKEIPGVYFFLGASDFQKGLISMPHSPNFQADEQSIKYGVNYFSSLIYEKLK